MAINTDPQAVENFLNRGISEVIGRDELRTKMLSGKQLRAYVGYDVTGPNLHLGHASTMLKLRHWQQLGHQVVMLIGDYTARVGDHSDKLDKRKRLTDAEIEENKDKFIAQFGKVLDMTQVELHYNSEWLSKLSFLQVVELASQFTVSEMISRENFAIRLREGKEVGFEELMYPLMQGYDAYALKVDLQLGGVDQIFNLIAGRKIMKHFEFDPQSIITMPLISGTDGRKMSKTWNNYVAIMATAEEMYNQIMQSTDEVQREYWTQLTLVDLKEVDALLDGVKSGATGVIEAKQKLAFEITKSFNGEAAAEAAQTAFQARFASGQTAATVYEVKVSGATSLRNLTAELKELGLVASNSDLQRMVEQKGVSVSGVAVENLDQQLELGTEIKFGKRGYVNLSA